MTTPPWMAEFRRAAADRPEGAPLDESFIASFAEGGEPVDSQREAYYRYIVRTTIAGVAANLSDPTPTRHGSLRVGSGWRTQGLARKPVRVVAQCR